MANIFLRATSQGRSPRTLQPFRPAHHVVFSMRGVAVRTRSKASEADGWCEARSNSTVAALKSHRCRQNEERLRLGDLWQDHDLVFPNRLGKPLDHNNLYYREYKPLLQSAGLGDEGFTFHSLRHTFATELFTRRMHPKIVQSLLGHSSITQTMDRYSHLMEDIGGDAVEGLDESFG